MGAPLRGVDQVMITIDAKDKIQIQEIDYSWFSNFSINKTDILTISTNFVLQ